MTDLIICPCTAHAPSATTYFVLWPHDGRYSILWSMWCSSLRWALQDAAQDFQSFLNEMFPDGTAIHFRRFNNTAEIIGAARKMNLGQTYDLPRLGQIRRNYGLPPWKPHEDKYRYINYEID